MHGANLSMTDSTAGSEVNHRVRGDVDLYETQRKPGPKWRDSDAATCLRTSGLNGVGPAR